ncbi:MAG: RluA family pseudouridine synthase [Fibrobacterota bacterium]
MFKLPINEAHDGRRADRIARKLMPNLKLGEIYALFRKGAVKSGKTRIKSSYRLKKGETITFFIDPSEIIRGVFSEKTVATLKGSRFFKQNYKPVFEDEHLLVLDKPAGIPVHTGTGHKKGTTMIDILHSAFASKCSDDGIFRPSFVNRLDKDTSGLIIAAKTQISLKNMNRIVKNREINKIYSALVFGKPSPEKGKIKLPLKRSASGRVTADDKGLRSETVYKLVKNYKNYSLLEVRLITGRMHQIRVHFSENGFPIIGDSKYGFKPNAKSFTIKRQMLHCSGLDFLHPVSGKNIKVESGLPEDFMRLV